MSYTNFHLYHFANSFFQLIQREIDAWFTPVIRDASIDDGKTLHKTPSFVSCIIFLPEAYQIFLHASRSLSVEGCNQSSRACLLFVFWVPHIRFETWLLSLLLSRWRTIGWLWGFGRYVSATRRLIRDGIIFQSRHKSTCTYPVTLPIDFSHFHLYKELCTQYFFGWLQILPSWVIAYLHSNQGMSFIKTIKKIVYRMRYSTLGTLSSVCCNIQGNYTLKLQYAK